MKKEDIILALVILLSIAMMVALMNLQTVGGYILDNDNFVCSSYCNAELFPDVCMDEPTGEDNGNLIDKECCCGIKINK